MAVACGSSRSLAGLQRKPSRVPRALDPQAVALAGADVGEQGHARRARCGSGSSHAGLGAVVVEEADLDGVGHLGRDGEIGAVSVGVAPRGKGRPRWVSIRQRYRSGPG